MVDASTHMHSQPVTDSRAHQPGKQQRHRHRESRHIQHSRPAAKQPGRLVFRGAERMQAPALSATLHWIQSLWLQRMTALARHVCRRMRTLLRAPNTYATASSTPRTLRVCQGSCAGAASGSTRGSPAQPTALTPHGRACRAVSGRWRAPQARR